MNENDRYQQGALPLAPLDTPVPDALTALDAPAMPPIDRDPDVLPNRRLPDDFWPEFHWEWLFREQHGLRPVSPQEFADMRDWSDGVTWSVPDWAIPSAYGPSEGYDDILPDAPRSERTVFDGRKERLDATIDVLAGKIEQLVTGTDYRAWLTMLSRFHAYSANNVALIHAQRPGATKVMGYGNKQGTTGWKSMGRHVREGEKGIRIIRPMKKTLEDPETEEKRSVLVGFTTTTVFDISQTEGAPLPAEPRPVDLTPNEAERSLELSVHLHRFVDEAGVRVVRDMDGAHRGYWNPLRREIGIRADLTGVQALKTLAHETAHMLANHRREGIAEEDAETVAESVAFVLLDHYGIDTSSYSVPYIANWARDPAVVQRNLDTVRMLSHVLLTAFGDHSPLPEDRGGAEEG